MEPDILFGTRQPLADLDGAHLCRTIAKAHARTFFVASRLLPEAKRRAAFAVYATCRVADDLVDGELRDSAERLVAFKTAALTALLESSDDPVLSELGWAFRTFGIPRTALSELLDGIAQDLQAKTIRTWPDLLRYSEGVAGSVGEMCCAIFGVAKRQDTAEAVSAARSLGVAMQLTNILRDVGEDAARGRCYFPVDELRAFDLTPRQVIAGDLHSQWPAWQAFMTRQVERARGWYRRAVPGIALLEPDARACALACAAGYSKILDAVEAAGFDTLSRRVYASRLTLLGVALDSWRGRWPTFGPDRPAALDGANGTHG